MAINFLAPTSAAGIGKTLGLSQGGAPATVLGYKSSSYQQPATAAPVDMSEINKLMNRIAQLQSQAAYVPRLPQFDVMGNYNRARSQAESAVNPLYSKYLRDFLAGQETKRSTTRGQIGLEKESTALELQQALAGNAVTRTRTGEDVAGAIDKLNVAEGQMQQDTGTAFDVDRRALAEQNAARGLTTSGVGQAQIFDQQNLRNLDEGRQVQEYGNQRQAKKLFGVRTFEDLARGDKDAADIGSLKDKKSNFDLEAYLQELAHSETQFRNENEYKRVSDVINQTGSYERAGVKSFLDSLVGSGRDARDIQYAVNFYGGK